MDISLNHKLSEIQTELKVHKSQRNKFGNYNYRTAEDFTEALKPFLLKYDVTVTVKEKSLGGALIQSTAIISDGVQRIKATSIVCVDTEQKGMAMPQRYGAASSYGKKYALGNLFLIDDTQDADATNKHDKDQKTVLIKNTPNYKKVVDAIKIFGYTIEDVKKKYTVNDELILELEQINK